MHQKAEACDVRSRGIITHMFHEVGSISSWKMLCSLDKHPVTSST